MLICELVAFKSPCDCTPMASLMVSANPGCAGAFPVLNLLNVMQLRTPASAILSAVIFNALIIIALIPLALRGVTYRPLGAAALLRRNLLIYGVGGVIAPFFGIKLIDIVLTRLGLA